MGITRFAIVADTHADESSRLDEHDRILDWVVADALARGCDALLHAGDLFERRSTSRERESVVGWIRKAAAEMPVVLVAGNHDDPRDIELLGKLRARQPIVAATRPEAINIYDNDRGNALLASALLVPWPRRGQLIEAVPEGTPREALDGIARESLRAILRGYRQPPGDEPRIVLAHAMIRGARVSNSQPPLIGTDLEIGVEDLAEYPADLYALGHIHLTQRWALSNDRGHDAAVVYPGAPRHCNWGELEPKGYMVATFDGPTLAEVEFVETPCRRMIDLRARFEDGAMVYDAAVDVDDLSDAEVRLRYEVAAPDRDAARECAQHMIAMFRDAVAVKVEERVVVETRARVAEVALAPSIADKLERYWDAQPEPPDDETRARLLAKLDTLQSPEGEHEKEAAQ